jgi:5-methylcytosine-specific restriction endonuclease McrA
VRERERYAKNPTKRSAYMKAWRARNPAKARAYVRASGNKRRAAAADQHFTAEEWFALLDAYHGKCGYGDDHLGPLEADHRIPLCRGGSNTIDNIIPACRRCNRRKWRTTEEEFRRVLAAESSAAAANR